MSGLWSEEAGDPSHPLVLLIHGSMDRSAGMLKLSRRLDMDYAVLRYDRRGYGRSSPHAGPFGMIDQVEDVVELLAGRTAVLIGHSLGGNIALAAADRCPAQVAGVALYEMPLSWEPWWPRSTAGTAAIAASAGPEQAAESFMRRMLGEDRWEALPERTKEIRRKEGPAMVAELGDLRRTRPWSPERIRVPVISAFGSRGEQHHRDGMRFLAAQLACPLVELPDCRHDAPFSHAEEFRKLVVDPLMAMVGPPWGPAAATAQRP